MENTCKYKNLLNKFKSEKYGIILILFVVVLYTFSDLSRLLHYSMAVGIDGYYYVIQAESLCNQNRLFYSNNAPLVLYFIGVLAYFISNTILAIKIASVIFHALICLGITAIVAIITRYMWLGVISGILVLLPTSHLFMISEFIRNSGGIALLIWSIWLLIKAIQTRHHRYSILSIGCFFLAIFCHKSIVFLSLLLGFSSVLIYFLICDNKGLLIKFSVGVLAFLVLIAPKILLSQHFIEIPLWLEKEFVAVPHFPILSVSLAERLLLLVVSPIIIFLLIAKKNISEGILPSVVFGSTSLFSLVIILNPFLSDNGLQSVIGRLNSLSYLLVAITVPGLLWMIKPYGTTKLIYVGSFVFPLILLSTKAPLPRGLAPDYLQHRKMLIEGLQLNQAKLNKDSLIIAAHGNQFIITSILKISSQQFLPQSNNYQSIYWLLDSIEDTNLVNSSICLFSDSEKSKSIIIENSQLLQYLSWSNPTEKRNLFIHNPHVYRNFATD